MRRKVTVVGGGNVGATAAQEIARRDYADVVLVDIKENLPQGKALDVNEAADNVERAVADVIREGKSVTYDMKPTRDDPTAVGTSEVADAIIEKLGAAVRV